MAAEPIGAAASPEELDQLVKETDLGGREPVGKIGVFLAIVEIGRAHV